MDGGIGNRKEGRGNPSPCSNSITKVPYRTGSCFVANWDARVPRQSVDDG